MRATHKLVFERYVVRNLRRLFSLSVLYFPFKPSFLEHRSLTQWASVAHALGVSNLLGTRRGRLGSLLRFLIRCVKKDARGCVG